MTGAHVVDGHAVRVGVAHRVVGLAVMAADMLSFSAGVLRKRAQVGRERCTHILKINKYGINSEYVDFWGDLGDPSTQSEWVPLKLYR